MTQLHDTKRVLVNVELNSLKSDQALKRDWREGLQVLRKWDLGNFTLRDSKYGEATDVNFCSGWEAALGLGYSCMK